MTGTVELDRAAMAAALDEARRAAELGEVPVGAVLVREGLILARGHNRNLLDTDPTAHAEIVVLREAARSLGERRLPGTILYVTLEPCLMCLGAMVHARVAELVYAAEDPSVGATRAFTRIPVGRPGLNHRLAIRRGPGAEESAALLRDFFRARR